MRKEYLEVGKIVGTHGVNGMVRIQPWSDSGEFLLGFNQFYFTNGSSSVAVEDIRPHGRVVIASFKGIDSIESAEKLRGRVIYVKRGDASPGEGRYFISELTGCRVYDADTGAMLGILSEVSATGANDVWHIKNNKSEYLVPAIDEVIVSVDIDSEKVIIRPLKGIFDNED